MTSRQKPLFDPRPNLLSKRGVESITKPYHDALVETYVLSFNRYITCVDEDYRASIEQSPTVKPSMLQAYAVALAIEEFEQVDADAFGARISHCGLPNVRMILIQRGRNKILLRWKKLSSDLIVPRSCMGSQKAQDYFNHDPVAEVDNSATRVTMGYTVDPTGTTLTGVYLSSQVGEVLRFSIELYRRSDDSTPDQDGDDNSSARDSNEQSAPSPIRISSPTSGRRRAE